MTGLPVDHRLENYTKGYKSAWVVKKYGVSAVFVQPRVDVLCSLARARVAWVGPGGLEQSNGSADGFTRAFAAAMERLAKPLLQS